LRWDHALMKHSARIHSLTCFFIASCVPVKRDQYSADAADKASRV
jgi:hypothetical protein